jgi:hypothetical protein
MDHTEQTTNDNGPYHLPQYGPDTLLWQLLFEGEIAVRSKMSVP